MVVHETAEEYPRPQLVRPRWRSLDGSWQFAHDDRDRGMAQRWFGVHPAAARRFGRTIEVPFPPESPASGVHETGFHRVVWYRRTLTSDDFPSRSTDTDRLVVHFGAVDHEARVWLDGALVIEHVGGQTPFEVDVTDLMSARDGDHVLVVRAADDPRDRSLPRGKQDWRREPHGNLVPPHHRPVADGLDRDRPSESTRRCRLDAGHHERLRALHAHPVVASEDTRGDRCDGQQRR